MEMDWSQLPKELVDLISQKITSITDYVRFRAVCAPWRSATAARPRHLPPQAPWLMFPFDIQRETRSFLSLPDGKVHTFHLPEARGKRCFGFDHGWLVTVGLTPAVTLLNPLTRAQIELPPITAFPQVFEYDASRVEKEYVLEFRCQRTWWSAVEMRDLFLYKVVLSSNPTLTGSECVAMAFHSHNEKVFVCRVGGTAWTAIETELFDMLIDVRYFKGKFYAMNVIGGVAVWDDSPTGKVRLVSCFERRSSNDKFFFVETSGGLFVVCLGLQGGMTIRDGVKDAFQFFKLDVSGKPRGVAVKGIGSKMTLFLDGQHCLSVSDGESHGFHKNCIYTFEALYSQNREAVNSGAHDIGVLNMANGRIKQLHFSWKHDVRVEPAPFLWEDFLGGQRTYVWFTPSLC